MSVYNKIWSRQFFRKIGPKLSQLFFCKFFSVIMASVCFGRLIKIPENALALQSFLSTNNTEKATYYYSVLLKTVGIWDFHIIWVIS